MVPLCMARARVNGFVQLAGHSVPRIGTLKSLRREAARAMGPLVGRSITARLAVNTVFAWTQSAWDERIDENGLASAWKQAHFRLVGSSEPSVSTGDAASS